MKMLEISQSGLFLRQDLVLRNNFENYVCKSFIISNKAWVEKEDPI